MFNDKFQNFSFRMLQSTVDSGVLNINCCDPLGRSALLMAIDNENLEMVDLLLDNKVRNTLIIDTLTIDI